MGKKKNRKSISEDKLLLPAHPTTSTTTTPTTIIDTHTHLASTYESYRSKYPSGKYETVYDFVKGVYQDKNVEGIVDVWCEAPVREIWREFADSALDEGDRRTKWGGMEYWFVMGVHPHNAKDYTDDIEREILEAMNHPRCVGWGEMGLDYHYDFSPREIQRDVFTRQLKHAVRLGKPLTIHTREADEDTERILKEIVPKDYRIHIHCFTDTPDFGQKLLDHFPNLYIGVTGKLCSFSLSVITFASNLNTAEIVRRMKPQLESPSSLRILLETDAPYMIPSNIYNSLSLTSSGGNRLPISHSAMIPWTADFLTGILKEDESGWDTETVLRVGRENARKVYGV
ncbi:Metallo-dependent hydrolase [Marasmius fiardii PR-910]|nr:Metallo-dependent hydrolase [Marasmius fiardii PR-910]